MKSCKDCPYIKYEYRFIKTIFPRYTENEIINECWCEKIGNYVGIGECCYEEDDNVQRECNRQGPRKYNRYERKRRYKKRLERLADSAGRYPAGAYRIGYDGWWTDDINETKYVKRCYRGNHGSRRSRYLKTVGNRRVRRYNGWVPNKGGYKKVFDFWWELT